MIYVEGLKITLPVRDEVYKIKMKNIINPFSVGAIKGFKWESIVYNTFTVMEFYDDVTDVSSVTIDAG